MKFTVVVHDRENYRGGPVVNMRRLLPRLVQRGHEVRVLGLAGAVSPNLDWLTAEHGIEVTKCPEHARFTHQQVRWILRELRAWTPDLFVPNSFVCGFFAGRWAREAGIATLGYFRSSDAFHWAIADEFIFGDPRYALGGVACVSELLMDRLRSVSETKKNVRLSFMPSGVPVPSSVVEQRTESFNICYIGRLEQKAKRIHETAEALFRNLQIGICNRVGFFGSGSQEGWLREQVASRGLGSKVVFHGAVAPEQLPEQLMAYHASVLLSDYEGTPGAVMDAMAAGLVPITTRLAGGTSELVIDNLTGLQCDDRYDGFDDCCQRLAQDPALRRRLARNARQRIDERYSIEATVRTFENFADELVGTERSRLVPKIPWRLDLPPVRSELALEDRRPPGRRALAAEYVSDIARATQLRLWRAQ